MFVKPRSIIAKNLTFMVVLQELPDEILGRVLGQPCLSHEDVNRIMEFPDFKHIAEKIISIKTVLNLYFEPICRDPTQGCPKHSIDMHQYSDWSIPFRFNSSSVFDKYTLLQAYHHYNLYICVSDFTIDRLPVLKAMRGLQYKTLHVYIYFILPYCDSVMQQILNCIDVVINDVTFTIYALYFPKIQVKTHNIKLLNLVVCGKAYGVMAPIKIDLNPQCESLKIENHFVYDDYPAVEYDNEPTPKHLKSLEIDGLLMTPTFVTNLTRFHSLQSLTVNKSNNFTFQAFIQKLTPLANLTKLILKDCFLSELRDLRLDIAIPSLKILHIESGHDDQFNLINITFPTSLTDLKLSRKSMKFFKGNSILTGELINLDLSFNNLHDLELSGLSKHIHTVNLSYNRKIINDISLYLNHPLSNYLFSNVTNLILNGANITNQTLERLAGLYDQGGFSLSHLQNLSLSKNALLNLRCFNHTFFQKLPLRKLDLSYNKFHYLNQENFPINKATYPDIEYLDFTGNIGLQSIYNIQLDYDYLLVKLVNTKIKTLPDWKEIFPGKNNTIVYDL